MNRQPNPGYDRMALSANLLLHVREHPEGRVIVTPVDFPELSVDADTYEAALRGVTSKLTRQLRQHGRIRCGRRWRRRRWPSSTVSSSQCKRDKGKLRITIGLVVTMRETSGGLLYVVRAPEIPEFAIAVTLRDAVQTAARQTAEVPAPLGPRCTARL